MPRTLLNDWRTGHLFRTPTRGKCRYDRHESVTLVDGQWWGESSRGFECALAPEDPCTACGTRGEVEAVPDEKGLLQFDGPQFMWGDGKIWKTCEDCNGSGYVPGPHWPYRWPQPPPLRVDK